MQNEQLILPCPVDKPVDNFQKGSDYLDTYALLRNDNKNNRLQQKKMTQLVAKYLYHSGHVKEADRVNNCGKNWLPFSCSAGHRIYRQIACGLPFCPICDKTSSYYNQKRIKSVSELLLGFSQIGHYVFTLPKKMSESLPSSDKINKLYQLTWKIMQEFFDAEAGIVILHFCGDKNAGLHLHFDCSFPILYRNGDCDYPLIILELARAEWTQGIRRIFKQDLRETVIHYNFIVTLEQQYHLIKYITRSTIESEKFIELSDAQKEYCIRMSKGKNIRYYGKFVGKDKEKFLTAHKCSLVIEKEEKDLISQHICPICNEKMKPGAPVFFDDVPLILLEGYNAYTFIDRQIGAFLRGRERIRFKRTYSGLSDWAVEQMIKEIVKGAN